MIHPTDCDHKNQPWGAGVACSQCGAELFCPPVMLKRADPLETKRIRELWAAAGNPHAADLARLLTTLPDGEKGLTVLAPYLANEHYDYMREIELLVEHQFLRLSK